jgi:hypothetical protein
MLNENNLPKYFWVEAVATEVYIMNRTPTTIVHGMTPEEKFTGKKPDVSHLRMCRNPTLAKCGGEAQHFQSWGFGILKDSRMFRVRQKGPKHLTLRCSW